MTRHRRPTRCFDGNCGSQIKIHMFLVVVVAVDLEGAGFAAIGAEAQGFVEADRAFVSGGGGQDNLFEVAVIARQGCECLDQKMFAIMKLPNLKHFHVSPYTDLDHAIEHLRDDLILEVHCHPGNTFFAFSDKEVEADVRTRMRKIAVRQCGLFLSDIHSINARPERMTHWAACCRKYATK